MNGEPPGETGARDRAAPAVRRRWLAAGLILVAVLALSLAWPLGRARRTRLLREEIAASIEARIRAGVRHGRGTAGIPREYAEAFREMDLPEGFFAAVRDAGTPLPGVVHDGIAANGRALALLEEAALRSASALGGPVAPPDPWAPVRAAGLLDARALVLLREGDLPGAVAEGLLVHRMVRHLAGIPGAVPIVRTSLAPNLDLLAAAAGDPRLDGATARAALEGMLRAGEAKGISEGWFLAVYRAPVERGLLAMVSGGRDEVLRAQGWQPASLLERTEARLSGRALPFWKRIPAAGEVERAWRGFQAMDRVQRLRGPEGLRALEGLLAEFPEAADPGYAAAVANQWVPLLRDEFLLEARLEALRLAFALRIHESRTGRVPVSPADLVPGTLPDLPVDPFTGGCPRFEPSPDGWTLPADPPPGFLPDPGARKDRPIRWRRGTGEGQSPR